MGYYAEFSLDDVLASELKASMKSVLFALLARRDSALKTAHFAYPSQSLFEISSLYFF